MLEVLCQVKTLQDPFSIHVSVKQERWHGSNGAYICHPSHLKHLWIAFVESTCISKHSSQVCLFNVLV